MKTINFHISNTILAKSQKLGKGGYFDFNYSRYGKPIASESSNPEFQPYKYGDKEQETMMGLSQYDFHARQMDYTVVPRFTTIDPLAEKYYSISPYAYCGGNPIRFVDPTGMDIKIYYPVYDKNNKLKGYANWSFNGTNHFFRSHSPISNMKVKPQYPYE
jgi:RHS repeat-associated protein